MGALLVALAQGTVTVTGPSQFVMTATFGGKLYSLTVSGSGLTYAGSQQITGGEVSDFSITGPSGAVLDVSGLSAAGQVFQTALNGVAVNDPFALAPVLNGPINYEGSDASDTFGGGDYDDHLSGGAGNDVLFGNNGDDFLIGGQGADQLNGGAGWDVAAYQDSSAGVTVNLQTGTGQGGDAQGDTLVGIEGAIGSVHNDILTGDGRNNSLQGGLGADVINGGGGDFDEANYFGSNAGVQVNLSTGTAQGGHAQGDTLVSIENIGGSAHADILIGDDNRNFLTGRGGADIIVGGGGNDTANYSESAGGVSINLATGEAYRNDAEGDQLSSIEYLNGSRHADVLIGDDANNVIQGGMGADFMLGGGGQRDRVDYYDSQSGVSINLATGEAYRADAEGDVFGGFEGVLGSFFDDVLIGDNGDNALEGRGGADLIVGQGGYDSMFFGGETAVNVNLLTGLGSGGEAEGDQYSGIEEVVGTDHDDILIGDDFDNVIQGRSGADTLVGNGGRDAVDYWEADSGVFVSLLEGRGQFNHAQGDTIVGFEDILASHHSDSLQGDNGDNYIEARAGDDLIAGMGGNDFIDGGEGTDVAALAGLNGAGGRLFRFDGRAYAIDLVDGSYDTMVDVEAFQLSGSAWAPVLADAIGSFDALAYAAGYSDLTDFFGTDEFGAFEHYLESGAQEGRQVRFDAAEYLSNYADLRAAFGTNEQAATEHFLMSGSDEHRLSENALDYIASYADLIGVFGGQSMQGLVAAGTGHYQGGGYAEGRRDGIVFDARQYLDNYADLAVVFGGNTQAATQHFINSGHAEGRLWEDALTYVASYGDLIGAFGSLGDADIKAAGIQHFQGGGFQEGRRSGIDFDADTYLANYQDLRNAFAQADGSYDVAGATLHYINSGFSEGRVADYLLA